MAKRSMASFGPSVAAVPLVALMLAFLAFPPAAAAQETGTDIDIESLFGGDVIETAGQAAAGTAQAPAADPVKAALVTEKVRIGGSFAGTAGASATWLDAWMAGFDPVNPDSTDLSLSLKSTLFFDARPDQDFRVYGSARLALPFSTSGTFLTSTLGTTGTIEVPNIKVFEFFSDFSAGDRVFFRFGKSTVKWGVGYFWSPADVLNLESINVLDPEAQREGPVTFRLHVPVLGTQDNYYLYAVFDEEKPAFSTTALAARAEYLFGTIELGFGGWFRYDSPLRGMLTVSAPIGPLDMFGELTVASGSDKTFVTKVNGPPTYAVETATYPEKVFVSGTAGFSYNDANSHLAIVGQYYYNGEGYSDADRKARVSEAKAAIATLPAGSGKDAMSYAMKGLILGSGRHYGGAMVSKSELFTEDLSASVLVLANLSDWSGFVKPTITWEVVDRLKLSVGPTFVFGGADSEYVVLADSPAVTLSLTASLGAGSF